MWKIYKKFCGRCQTHYIPRLSATFITTYWVPNMKQTIKKLILFFITILAYFYGALIYLIINEIFTRPQVVHIFKTASTNNNVFRLLQPYSFFSVTNRLISAPYNPQSCPLSFRSADSLPGGHELHMKFKSSELTRQLHRNQYKSVSTHIK